MSCFAGMFHFDGRPADPDTTAAMGDAIAQRATDGGEDFCQGPLAMTYRAFHTTRESHWERQPMQGPSGELLCWDGRLDNRDELRSQLDCSLVPTDAELVMSAYREWGAGFLAHLVGDFALAIFDPRERQVLLGRDFFGARPLYYAQRGEKLMWSTDLLPLMQFGGLDLALDDDYIAQFVVAAMEPQRSPYRQIRAVAPGHVMVFRDGKVVRNGWYWRPDRHKEIRYATDRDYEEHFYELFRQAVKSRLRSGATVWTDLSGGLDSSSVTMMADEIVSRGRVDCHGVETWTAVNGESILTNELPYVRLVESRRGRSGYHLYEDELWFRNFLDSEFHHAAPTPFSCIPERFRLLSEGMYRSNARVRLSGHGGDHLLGNTPVSPELGDLVREFRFIELHRQLGILSASQKQPYSKLLFKHVLPFALPAVLRERFDINRYLRDCLPPGFRQRVPRASLQMWPSDPFGNATPSRRERMRRVLSAVQVLAQGLTPTFAKFEVRYPMLDRRLVEWMLAIPMSQIQRPGETRSLMRRAFRQLLPAEIWERRTKGTVDEGVCRGLNLAWSEVEEVVSGRRLVRRGFFESDYVERAVLSVAHGGSMGRGIFSRLIGLELWLRTIEQPEFRSTCSTRFLSRRTHRTTERKEVTT